MTERTQDKRTRSSGKSGEEASQQSVLLVEDLPETLGSDWGIYTKPEYVRARHSEDGESWDVISIVDDERVLTPLAADVFSSMYAAVAPSKVLNYIWVPK